MTRGQIISYHIGQCGVQTGNACWDLFNSEHGIGNDGLIIDAQNHHDFSFSSFYKECLSGYFVPRAIFGDLEPSVIDEIRTGANRTLFSSENLMSSHEGAANNFARGFYTSGRLMIKDVIFSTRKQVEACTSLKGFVVLHSYGGGTGSGFMSMLLEYLTMEYSKIDKIDIGLIPNQFLSSSSVEAYNCVLGMHHPMENSDLAVLYENEPLYELCKKNLSVKCPQFCHLNEIVSQIISGITCCTRFESPLGCNLNEIATNLVPYPRIHFPLLSFAPLADKNKNDRSTLSTRELTKYAFDRNNQLLSLETQEGRIMASCLLYKGPVSHLNVFEALDCMKKSQTDTWVEWCPTGFKVGITMEPFTVSPNSVIAPSNRSCTLLKNATTVRSVFNRLGNKFWELFSRKAFIHWYVGEGMEEQEFKDAFDDVMMLSSDLQLLEASAEEMEEVDITVLHKRSKESADKKSVESEEKKNKNVSHESYGNKTLTTTEKKVSQEEKGKINDNVARTASKETIRSAASAQSNKPPPAIKTMSKESKKSKASNASKQIQKEGSNEQSSTETPTSP